MALHLVEQGHKQHENNPVSPSNPRESYRFCLSCSGFLSGAGFSSSAGILSTDAPLPFKRISYDHEGSHWVDCILCSVTEEVGTASTCLIVPHLVCPVKLYLLRQTM